MKPLADFTVLKQSTSIPSAIETFAAMCSLKKSTLSLSAPLPRYDPAKVDYKFVTESLSIRGPHMLRPLTSKTRELLLEEMNLRIYS